MSMPALFKGRLSIPVIGAPLFIISVPDLVIAQCKAGIVGSFPALNARPPALLDEWLARIRQELGGLRPGPSRAAIGAVRGEPDRASVEQPARSGPGAVRETQMPIIITSLGAREELNQAAHRWGGIVFHDVINQKFAHKAIEKGADGLILVAAGAGGHAGEIRRSPSWPRPGMVRWTDRAVGCDRQRPRDPRRAAARRRLRLYRLRLYRHRRGQCGGGLQADDHRPRPRRTSSIPTCSPACMAII